MDPTLYDWETIGLSYTLPLLEMVRLHDSPGADPMQDTAITIATDLVREIGVADAWAMIVREGGHREMLVEVNRWRRWVRRRERRRGVAPRRF